MSLAHSNISVFVPHIGCPNKCSFCNQRYITGTFKAPGVADVKAAVETAKKSPRYNPKTTEIAFFGGSFTAINRNYMISLLEAAAAYVEGGSVYGIRISTRPDAIDTEILSLLKKYRVTAIELGAQSLNDRVLKMNNRGHTALDVVNSSALIKQNGFELGLQIMTGLYCDTYESVVRTAQKVIEIKPDTVRIYPTIVLKGTRLAALYADNIYKPQTLDSAIALSAKLYKMFTDAGIRVIRLGLHSIENEAYIAGPWHPAFSELCQSQIMLNDVLSRITQKGNYILYVNKSSISKMIGQKRSNILFLQSKGINCKVLEDCELKSLEIRIEKEK
ncbi:MAG: elongator complex protein 3 [Acutalibacteraceae bacterium]|jgi:histone acetyltransferase (RNA polymerase elongator complex component)